MDKDKIKRLLLEYATTTQREQQVVLWLVHKVEAEQSYNVRSRLTDARDQGLYCGSASAQALAQHVEAVQEYLIQHL